MSQATAPGLAAFQAAFVAQLWPAATDDGAPAATALSAQPAFAVYRNTVMKGCIDALEAKYPAVVRLVGSDWFRAAAAVFVPTEPPRGGSLIGYGAGFADFLRAFEPAAQLPYLADVARLDRCWTEAHIAADATPLAPDAVAQLAPEQLAALALTPHPAARWAWFDAQPIYTIWSRNRVPAGDDDEAELPWHAEGALLTRPDDGAVRWCELALAGVALLDACAAGAALAEAADAALAAQPDADLSALFAQLLRAGAFSTPADV